MRDNFNGAVASLRSTLTAIAESMFGLPGRSQAILGAVGVLQFEIIQHRLQTEYGVAISLSQLPYRHARWVEGEPFEPAKFERSGHTTCVLDVENRPLILFDSDWALRQALQDNPQLKFVAAVQPGRGNPRAAA